MKPALQVQFFLNNEKHSSTSIWISHKEQLQNWARLVMMISGEGPFPVEAICIAALGEQRCNCLN